MKPVSTLLALALTAAPATAQEPGEYVDRMEREHAGDRPVASAGAAAEPTIAVEAADAVYGLLEGTEIRGYVAHPAGEAPRSALLLIHEWWGLNDNIRAVARRFAGEGYLALAVDLYEGETGDDREEAGRLARAAFARRARLLANLRLAIDHLRGAGVERIGVIGWCFGGAWSLQAALAFPDDLDAAVIYYGRLIDDRDELAKLRAPILGIFGALDGGIPVTAVREFQLALDELGKANQIHVYEGADHAFANPSGTRYNEAAATDAWAKTLEFLGPLLR